MAMFTEVFAILLEAAHGLRMELAFLATFAALWGLTVAIPSKRPSGKAVAAQQCKTRSTAVCTTQAIHDVRNPTPAQLADPGWVLAAVQQLCRTQVSKAIKLYRDALQAGLELEQMSAAEASQLFMALVTSAIRAGLVVDALQLLRDCRRGPGNTAALLNSCVKVCTSKQLFKECIGIYDFISEDPAVVPEDPSVWSCLLFCATEAQMYVRCSLYFERLQACGPPSSKDFSNMVRCATAQGDWQWSLSLICKMRKAGLEVDSIVFNTVLATCVAAGRTDEARMLIDDPDNSGGAIDVITYNTLSKGYAKAGRIDDCFELLRCMRASNVAPSQVTYGILLDCCINEKQVEKAAEVFKEMTAEGLIMNTVLYTTLIKGFTREEKIDEAMGVYKQMCSNREKGVSPDLITFSILIKANCDAGRLREALGLLEAMLGLKICPDEVVFNNLLGGCIREKNPQLAKGLYNEMVERGVKPSNATFSILIRLYAECKVLDEALVMLSTEPEARNVKPEPRLYMQLAQTCLRERQGHRAVEVYKLMVKHAEPTAAVHRTLLGMCSKLNMLDTAVEILSFAVEHSSCIDVRDAMLLRDVAVKKRKVACVNAITDALTCLGVNVASG